MSEVRSEPADVWLINGRPARFVWRERLYTVLSILSRPSSPDWPCWTVTATSGRNVPASAYRLCRDPATDRWLLTRADR